MGLDQFAHLAPLTKISLEREVASLGAPVHRFRRREHDWLDDRALATWLGHTGGVFDERADCDAAVLAT